MYRILWDDLKRGEFNAGTIFKTDGNGDNLSIIFSWSIIEGVTPYGELCEADNGKLYGMTAGGGANDYGVLFEWDPATDTYTKKLDFNDTVNGRYPEGSLMQADNGKLYGMTYEGGTNDYGVLFEWDPVTDTYTKKLDFDGSENGRNPYGNLTEIINTVNTSVTQDQNVLTANATGAGYQWLDCNNDYSIISGETNQSYTATSNGSYAVEVTQDGCTDTSACYTVTGVGIIENEFGKSFIVYPNPTQGGITIELGQLYRSVTLTVKSLTGEIVSTYNFGNTDKLYYKLEGPNRLYLIEITTKEGKRATVKVMKD